MCSQKKVIIIEDDKGMRLLLKVILEEDKRFILSEAIGSYAELKALPKDTILTADIVLIDLTLPDIDGLDILRQLREDSPNQILALYTGWADPELMDKAKKLGANHIFNKALDPQEIFDSLASSLSQKQ